MILDLSDDPVVPLVSIVDRIRVRVFWCKSVVDAEDWHAKFISPASEIRLGRITRLRDKSTAMEMYDYFIDLLPGYRHLIGIVGIGFRNIYFFIGVKHFLYKVYSMIFRGHEPDLYHSVLVKCLFVDTVTSRSGALNNGFLIFGSEI
jgi:hypothetical protein